MNGPGWLNDIIDAKLAFEEQSYTVESDTYAKAAEKRDAKIKNFDGRGAVAGKLMMTPPDGRSISHNGVEIIFKSTSIIFGSGDMLEERDVVHKRWVLLEPAGSCAAASWPGARRSPAAPGDRYSSIEV